MELIKTTSDLTRERLLSFQLDKEKNLVKAQEIVLEHLESSIKSGESATVAAMPDILKA